MATDTLPEPPVTKRKAPPAELVIDRQLRRTQFQVRIVDIIGSLVVWVAAVLTALFLLAVCDHWIVSIGEVGRWLALVSLVLGSVYYFAVHLGPLLWRRINSAYAAKVIEDAEPSLKNSLLNFLLLRGNPAGVPEVVVDALRDRAASDLTHTPVEQAVDRAPLIRLGYILCGVMVVFAAYKLLSPKDPFRTVARVLAPWAEIARPSRVQIAKVEPGDKEVYQGQMVTVTAEVRGQRSSDPVEVVYSTADGQTLNAAATMNHVAGMEYSLQLPPGTGDGGMQQDIVYRVKAGDAESLEYRLHVLPSPRIEVERIELEFPRYTNRQPQTIMRQGDIRAVEGTRVAIHAKANQEIASAYIEFDPTPNAPTRRDNVLAMQVDGMSATAEFPLERLRDGAARHTSYQIRLVNRDNLQNDRPTIHRIEALADLPPEIEVLAPMERRVELPADRTLKFELRGRDPDFGLCKIALELSRGEQSLDPATLFQLSGGQLGNTKVDYVVSPQKLGLQPGDDLLLVGVAEDNRHDAAGQPAANVSRTDRYVIHITAPEARQEKPLEKPMADERTDEGTEEETPMPKKPGEREKPQSKPGEKPKSKPNETGDKPEEDTPKESKPEEKNGNKGNKGNAGSSKKEQKKPGESPKEKSEGGEGEKNEKKPQTGGEGGGNSEEQQEGGQEEERSAESEGTSGGETQGNKSKGSRPGNKSTGGASGDDPSDEGSSESEATEEGSDSAGGANSSKGGNKKNTSRKPSTGGEPGENTGSDSADPGESTGADSTDKNGTGQSRALDSEAIERINKELEKNPELRNKLEGENKADGGNKTGNENTGNNNTGAKTGAEPGEKPQQKPGEKPRPKPGEKPEGEPGANAGENPQQSPGNQDTGAENNNSAGQPKPGEQASGGKPKSQPGKSEQPMPGEKPMKPEEGEGDSATGEQNSDQGTNSGSNKTPSPMTGGGKKPDENTTSKKPSQGEQGTAGSGEKPEKPNPAGQPQERPMGRQKTPKPDGGEKNSGEASASPSSKKESDSTGGTSGDQAGGGEQGPGQSAKQEGNDAPGSSSSADEGAGKSQEEGNGETGEKGGKGPKSERPTGQTGNDEGPGSAKKPGEKGTQPDGSKSGEGAGDKTGSPMNVQRDPTKGRPSGDAVRGGGKPSEGDPVEGGPRKDVADTEAENLEFAKKSTDLALQYLKDQKDNPDPEMLKKLGWTKDDLSAFLKRWEDLKSSAKEGGEAKEELNDAYRSLGLRPAGDKRRSAGAGDDAVRGNRDAGARSEPPPGYAEQFKAFRKGAGK